MNGTFEPTRERRTGYERRRNTAQAINPAVAVVETAAVGEGARRISWGAISAGVVLALITQLVLTLVAVTLGLNTGDKDLGRGTAIWMVVSTVIALFTGGAVAGRLAGVDRKDGALHGLLTWGIMALIAFYLATTAVGRALSFSSVDITSGINRMRGEAGATTQGEPSAIPGTMPQRNEARDSATSSVGTETPTTASGLVVMIESVQPTAQSGDSVALERLRARGDAPINSFDRDDAIMAVVDRTGKTRDEAKAMVDGWMAHGRGAIGEQRPAPVTEDTGTVGARAQRMAGHAAFWTFIGLCVGALAATSGGFLGGRSRRYVQNRTLVS